MPVIHLGFRRSEFGQQHCHPRHDLLDRTRSGGATFANILGGVLVVTGLLNLSTIPVPKITGRGYYAIALWTIAVAAVLVGRLATAA